MKWIVSFFSLIVILSCAHNSSKQAPTSDPFISLEDIRSSESMKWVKAENDSSSLRLKSSAEFEKTKTDIKQILSNKDRIPSINIVGDYAYNHWTDEKNPRGLWRRTKVAELETAAPKWDVLIDVDALGKTENESWVLKHVEVERTGLNRALVFLSRKGKDATVMREFDITTKTFLVDGFYLPEAKLNAGWVDSNTLLISTDFGPNTMTESGYGRMAKLWKRNQTLTQAQLLLESPVKNMGMWIQSMGDQGKGYLTISDRISFYEGRTYLITNKGEAKLIPIPLDSDVEGIFRGDVYFVLKSELKTSSKTFSSGSLLKLSIQQMLAEPTKATPELVFASTQNQIFSKIAFSKTKRWLTLLNQVNPNIFELTAKGQLIPVRLPSIGNSSIMATSDTSNQIFLTYANFSQPTTFYSYKNKTIKKIKSLPSLYNAEDIVIEQKWATSKDGTRVPYYLVRHKNIAYNSKNPTLLYAYGGFEFPLVPSYLDVVGKAWLESGGTYVLANIRGGGEFGPSWHQSALKTKRQRAFDDFFAVAEDLIQTKVTSSDHLGIKGGSNGGLLMGVALTQRPDLFKAIVCEVPLMDMSRYHLLLAGASWVAEYGSPDVPSERDYLLSYSPYQNVSPTRAYPEIFITTSTEDDRVHPGHARKMAAKLKSLGKPYLYFENTEGGHGRTADLNQAADYLSMQYTFLKQKLF